MNYSITCITFLLLASIMTANGQTRINHVAIYAKDIQASGEFYEKIVGLKEIDEPFKDGLHIWYDMGLGTSLHVIAREHPWTNPSIEKDNHLCFSVADLDGFIKQLVENKIPYEDARGNPSTINIRPDGIRQIYIQDPSGYWLEINDEY
ncbi:MAG: VOC family protein [Lunatimonas sp.]|uniref:VOC family protein n=1 Tax=Lunatimonas sp. TaxID=2060141 RepID=UPI00263A8D09|nr:VOC family protein [Lunatimonas sp.]MCC5936354.1 VOC family protein [Lunatimonas sp.]